MARKVRFMVDERGRAERSEEEMSRFEVTRLSEDHGLAGRFYDKLFF